MNIKLPGLFFAGHNLLGKALFLVLRKSDIKRTSIYGFYGLALLGCVHTAPQQPLSLQAACERGASQLDWSSCNDYAFQIEKSSPKESKNYYDKACSHQIGRGCSNLGYIAANQPQKPDFKTARRYYEKGCRLGDGVGCHNLANLYLDGIGFERDSIKAVGLLQKSCDLNYGQACYRVGAITLMGKLLPKNDAATATLYQKACDLGEVTGCYDLGYLYLDGKGVTRDDRMAYQLFAKTCQQGLMKGCTTRAYLDQNGGEGVEKIEILALADYLKACGAEEATACSNFGYMTEMGLGKKADPALAAQYYSKACGLKDEMGCNNLGVLLVKGKGIARNDADAVPYLQIGCVDRIGESCRYLALFHAKGRGGLPRSRRMVAYYRKQACAYGEQASCTRRTASSKISKRVHY